MKNLLSFEEFINENHPPKFNEHPPKPHSQVDFDSMDYRELYKKDTSVTGDFPRKTKTVTKNFRNEVFDLVEEVVAEFAEEGAELSSSEEENLHELAERFFKEKRYINNNIIGAMISQADL